MPSKSITKQQTKKILHKLYLLKYAATVRNITELANLCGVSRNTVYRYMEDSTFSQPLLAKLGTKLSDLKPVSFEEFSEKARIKGEVEIDVNTAEDISKRAFKRVATTKKVITVKIPAPSEGKQSHKMRLDTRILVGKQICKLVEAGVPTKAACEQLQVTDSEFYQWISPAYAGYVQPVAVLYEEAKLSWRLRHSEQMVGVARRSLENLIADKEFTETHRMARIEHRDDGTGKLVPTTVPTMVRQITKHREAKMDAIRLVLTALDKDFSPAQAHATEHNKEEIKFISEDELDKRIEEAKKIITQKG